MGTHKELKYLHFYDNIQLQQQLQTLILLIVHVPTHLDLQMKMALCHLGPQMSSIHPAPMQTPFLAMDQKCCNIY